MADPESTRAMQIAGLPADGANGHHEATHDAWSFGVRPRLFARLPHLGSTVSTRRPPVGNRRDVPTVAPRRAADTAAFTTPLRNPNFGKRGFSPVYQWEGVVEEVSDSGFRGRLTPFDHGRPNLAQVEYADFDFRDLDDPSDRTLVQKDAVFYWTVGKSRNQAGTYTNTSLVRFRRLPGTTNYDRRRASEEAAALLRDLDNE
jgi:hypothetical protein